MIDPDWLPYIQARWFISTYGRDINWVVLHDMEFPERPDSAEWCAGYFARTEKKASTHFASDADSIIRCLYDHMVAYGANGVNRNGLHIEMAGYAGQSGAEWNDPYSLAVIDNTADLTAALCKKYFLPIQFVDASGLRAGVRGITTHAEAERAFPDQGHWDPGPEFPIDHFINVVKAKTYHYLPGADDMTPEQLGLVRDPNNPQSDVYGMMLLESLNPETYRWYPYSTVVTYIHQWGKIRDLTGR